MATIFSVGPAATRQFQHRSDRRNGKHAVGKAQHGDIKRQRPPRPGPCRQRQAGKRQCRREAAADDPTFQFHASFSAKSVTAHAHQDHARQHALMLHARQAGGLAGGHAEHQPGKWFQNQILHRIGQHGKEHEDAEQPGERVLPDAAQGFVKRRSLALFLGLRRAFDTPHRKARDTESHCHHAGRHLHQPFRRVRIKQAACGSCRNDDADDHHDPRQAGRCRAPGFGRAGGEQRQQRRARRAHADADHRIGQHQCGKHRPERAREPGGGIGRQQAAGTQYSHAADDPRGAPPAGITAMAPFRPGQLHPVMKRYQAGRQRGGGGIFHHHDAIEQAGRQHDNGAQCALHQAEPGDAGPCQIGPGRPWRRLRHHTITDRPNAAVSMPSTYNVVPVAL